MLCIHCYPHVGLGTGEANTVGDRWERITGVGNNDSSAKGSGRHYELEWFFTGP